MFACVSLHHIFEEKHAIVVVHTVPVIDCCRHFLAFSFRHGHSRRRDICVSGVRYVGTGCVLSVRISA